MENKQYLTLKEAVEVSGKSIATLRRKKAILEELGAICSTKGWQVTVEQLTQAGLIKDNKKTKNVNKTTVSSKTSNKTLENELKKEIELLTKTYENQIKDLKQMLEIQTERAEKAENRLEKMMDILSEKYVITKKQKQGLGQIFKK